MKLVGWIEAQKSDKARLRDTFDVKGKMVYNEAMECFEYCTLDSMEAIRKLWRELPSFYPGAFTALDGDGNQLPQDEQPCRGLLMTVDEANRTHDWNKHMDLSLCKVCGMSKISAHIWGDSDWTKNPIPCFGRPEDAGKGE